MLQIEGGGGVGEHRHHTCNLTFCSPHLDADLSQCRRICLLVAPTARSSPGVLSEVACNERALRILRACRQRRRYSPLHARPAAHHSCHCHRKHMTASRHAGDAYKTRDLTWEAADPWFVHSAGGEAEEGHTLGGSWLAPGQEQALAPRAGKAPLERSPFVNAS